MMKMKMMKIIFNVQRHIQLHVQTFSVRKFVSHTRIQKKTTTYQTSHIRMKTASKFHETNFQTDNFKTDT